MPPTLAIILRGQSELATEEVANRANDSSSDKHFDLGSVVGLVKEFLQAHLPLMKMRLSSGGQLRQEVLPSAFL